MDYDYKLLYRHEAVQMTEDLSKATETGSGGFFLISGPAGIGKSTLFCQLRRELARRSIHPLILQYDLPPNPSLEDALASFISQASYLRPQGRFLVGLSRYQNNLIGELLNNSGRNGNGFMEPPSGNDLFMLSQTFFGSAARDEGHGLFIIVEDMHLADQQILTWMENLGRYILIEEIPISLAISCREAPNAGQILKKLEALAQELSEPVGLKRRLPFTVCQLRLQALSPGSVAAYLDGLFQPGFSLANSDFTDWLYQQSYGRPYYLRLLLNVAGEQSIIHQMPEIGWIVKDNFRQLRLPQRLEDMVWSRIEVGLSRPDSTLALEALAAIGSPSRFEDWHKLTNASRGELIETLIFLEGLELARDVFFLEEHQVVFAHPLVGELIVEKMSSDRRLEWSNRISDFLLKQGNTVRALDRWLHLSGAASAPISLILDALSAAVEKKDWSTILNWYRSLTDLATDARRFIWLKAVVAAKELAQPQLCLDIARSGEVSLQQLSTSERLLYYQALHFCLIESEPASCQELLNKAFAWADNLPQEDRETVRKELSFLQLALFQSSNDFERCLGLGRRLKDEWAGDTLFCLRINNTLGQMYLFKGNLAESEAIYRRNVLPYEKLMPAEFKAKAFFNLAKVLSRLAKYDPAEYFFLRAKDICEQELLHDTLLTLRADFAAMRWRQGRHREALEELEAVYRAAFIRGNIKLQTTVLDSIVGIRGEIGESDGLLDLLFRNLALKGSLGNDIGRACTMINLAECFSQGIGTMADPQSAYEWSSKALGILRKAGTKKFMAEALINLSQACLALGYHAEAVERAQAAFRHAEEFSSPQIIALARGCLGRALSDINPKEAEGLLLEAVSAFERLGNRYETARHLEVLGRLRTEIGHLLPASEDISQAASLYRELNLNLPLAKLVDDFPQIVRNPIAPRPPSSSLGEPKVRILLLGSLQIFPLGQNEPILEGNKGQIALKIIAFAITEDFMSRRGIPGKRLLEQFWGKKQGSGSMRVALSRLRKAIGLSLLSYSDGVYRFPWEDQRIYLDWEHLETTLHQATVKEKLGDLDTAWSLYEQAESLFRGEFLQNLDEPWVQNTRKNFSSKRRQLLLKLIELSEKIGKRDQAVFFRNKLF